MLLIGILVSLVFFSIPVLLVYAVLPAAVLGSIRWLLRRPVVLFWAVVLSPLLYSVGKVAFTIGKYAFLLAYATLGDALIFIFNGKKNFHIANGRWMNEFWIALRGEVMKGIEEIFALLNQHFGVILGLALFGYLIYRGIVYAVNRSREPEGEKPKSGPKKDRPWEPSPTPPEFQGPGIPVKPIAVTFFDAAELKHDRTGTPYVAVGILMDAVNERAYYMGFYNHDKKLRYVYVVDEMPYDLTGLSPISKRLLKQAEKAAAPLRLKAQATLNSLPDEI